MASKKSAFLMGLFIAASGLARAQTSDFVLDKKEYNAATQNFELTYIPKGQKSSDAETVSRVVRYRDNGDKVFNDKDVRTSERFELKDARRQMTIDFPELDTKPYRLDDSTYVSTPIIGTCMSENGKEVLEIGVASIHAANRMQEIIREYGVRRTLNNYF